MSKYFPAQVPVAELTELVTMLRSGASPAALLDNGLWCAGCLVATFGPAEPSNLVSAGVLDDASAADQIEAIVADDIEAGTVAAAAPGVAPAWLSLLMPILMQLLQKWMAK